ncbi:MAG: flagellar biosynthesis protein FlhF, partial [Gallionellales bacterium CG_4_9_14_0_8_um_filter_59_50]
MNARKFIAASSREALQLVRAELGAEAVILSNRKSAAGVEIVAMAGSELAHLNETRMVAQHAEQTRSAPRQRAAANLSGRALDQAAALGAKVVAAQAEQAAPPRVETPQANHAAQQLMHELQAMHDTMQAQMAGMAWSTLQQQDPQRSGLLRD